MCAVKELWVVDYPLCPPLREAARWLTLYIKFFFFYENTQERFTLSGIGGTLASLIGKCREAEGNWEESASSLFVSAISVSKHS